MKTKPKNPYTELLKEIRSYVQKVTHPVKRLMWRYQKEKLSEGWKLDDLSERVRAADQLGYDCVLRYSDRAGESGLEVYYVQRPPEPTYSWR